MRHFVCVSFITLTVLLATGCHGHRATAIRDAELYAGVDRYSRAIGTDAAAAQRYFDQGLLWAYGFNHAAAIRSFERAAALDPSNPMPWWGIAYAHGMNINDPVMTDERWRAGRDAAAEARRRLNDADQATTMLVDAVSRRYAWPPPPEQRPLDQQYADAMQQAWSQFPGDSDIATLYAESLMNLQPWDYWTDSGEPKGRILEVVDVLESVLAHEPDHPGAAHFYIHAVEASSTPQRADAAAQMLENRVPGAGHLVHMPSHIYVRTGRYAEASDVNVRAVAADQAYFDAGGEADTYWIYVAHNLHFLSFASMMESRYETALHAARELERRIPEEALRSFAPLIEGIMPTTLHVMVRFGRWEDILAEPARADFRLMSHAVRHYARGVAYAATGRVSAARRELGLFDRAAAAIPEDWWVFNNKAHAILPIGRHVLEAEIAFRDGRHDEAFAALRAAAAMEDALVYDEPPGWMLPVRHSLGALLMSAGRYAEAEAVYREDLLRNVDNGWSLLGLEQSLAAQGARVAERDELRARLASAWARADVTPTASCLCEPQSQWIVKVAH